MTDLTELPAVLGCSELADAFGLTHGTVHVMRRRPGVLPEPDQMIGGRTPVWYKATVLAWAHTSGRVDVQGQAVRLHRRLKTS